MSMLSEETGRAELTPPRRAVPWTGLDIVLALLVGVLLGTVFTVGLIGLPLKLGVHFRGSFAFFLFSITAYGGLALSVWYFALARHHAPWSTLGFRWVGWRPLLVMIPLVFVLEILVVVVTALMVRLIGQFENPQNAQMKGLLLSAPDLFWLLLAASVVAPLVEEMTFRGLIYRWLRVRISIPGAVTLSAILFAVAHVYPILLPVLFVMGVALAIVSQYYDSLYPSMVLHALNNGLALLAVYMALHTSGKL